MLQTYTFHLSQLGFLKESMDQIATFRPDGKTPAQVQALITAAETVKTAFLEDVTDTALARGELTEAHQAGHAAAVTAYAQMKNVYVDNASKYEAILKLPTKDRTVVQANTRMTLISNLWAKLPNAPGTNAPFCVGTLDQTAFDALLTTLEAKNKSLQEAISDGDGTAADLHKTDAANVKFITTALKQGRTQFKRGTSERMIIDAIPTPRNTPIPNRPVIESVEDLGGGSIMLIFTALHATSFKVFQQAPGATAFTQIAENVQAGEYTVDDLAAGAHKFKVCGVNSRGTGKASAVWTFTMPLAVAA